MNSLFYGQNANDCLKEDCIEIMEVTFNKLKSYYILSQHELVSRQVLLNLLSTLKQFKKSIDALDRDLAPNHYQHYIRYYLRIFKSQSRMHWYPLNIVKVNSTVAYIIQSMNCCFKRFHKRLELRLHLKLDPKQRRSYLIFKRNQHNYVENSIDEEPSFYGSSRASIHIEDESLLVGQQVVEFCQCWGIAYLNEKQKLIIYGYYNNLTSVAQKDFIDLLSLAERLRTTYTSMAHLDSSEIEFYKLRIDYILFELANPASVTRAQKYDRIHQWYKELNPSIFSRHPNKSIVLISFISVCLGFIMGAIVGASMAAWSGPGAILGAITGGFVGAIKGGSATTVASGSLLSVSALSSAGLYAYNQSQCAPFRLVNTFVKRAKQSASVDSPGRQ